MSNGSLKRKLTGTVAKEVSPGYACRSKSKILLNITDQTSRKRSGLPCIECSISLSSKNEALKHYRTEHQQSVTATVKWAKGKKAKNIRYWRSGDDFMFHCQDCGIPFKHPKDIQMHTINLSERSAAQHSAHKESIPAWLRKKYNSEDSEII